MLEHSLPVIVRPAVLRATVQRYDRGSSWYYQELLRLAQDRLCVPLVMQVDGPALARAALERLAYCREGSWTLRTLSDSRGGPT